VFCLLAFNSVEAAALNPLEQCKIPSKLDYKVSNKKAKKDTQVLVQRTHNQVTHYYPSTAIIEGWELNSANQLKPTRYFQAHKRAIEYQANEHIHGKIERDWAYRYQLISEKLLAQSSLISSQGEGCELTETRLVSTNKALYKIVYKPHQKSLLKLDIKSLNDEHVIETWSLQNAQYDPQATKTWFAELAQYQSTDYADIGDDHSDPFLTKMVSIGFIEAGASGHYHAFEDNKINSVGSHQH
jgi:hypothetical protein